MYVVEDPPPEFVAIDDALRSLGPEATAVVESRYVKYPKKYARKGLMIQTGGEKARLNWVNQRVKKKMSARRYRDVLTSCKRRLAEILGVAHK